MHIIFDTWFPILQLCYCYIQSALIQLPIFIWVFILSDFANARTLSTFTSQGCAHTASLCQPPGTELLLLRMTSRRCFPHWNNFSNKHTCWFISAPFSPNKKVDLFVNLFDEFQDGNYCLIMIKPGNHSKDDWLCNESQDKQGITWNFANPSEQALHWFLAFICLLQRRGLVC